MEKRFIGYHLIRSYDPFTVAYVGIGLPSRPKKHKQMAVRGAHPNRTLQSIFDKAWGLDAGDLIVRVLVRELTWEEAVTWEIDQIKSLGRIANATGDLANLTDGGDGRAGYECSEETKSAMSKSAKGKAKTPESIEKMRRSLTGRKLSPEVCAAISAGKIGYTSKLKGRKLGPQSAEHRAKIGAKVKGYPRSDEWRQRLSESMKRRNHMKQEQERNQDGCGA